MSGMITIGQLADYAGVTTKAIRHYHERGLLAEPDRDSSGYRRYTAKDAIDLVKIRTLATAGAPLARIKDLLDADPDALTAAIAEIDHNLQDRIAQLRRTRDQLAQLPAGDRLFVSPEVADYLDDLRELGISERQIHLERDGWILMQTASPEDASQWIAEKRELITDPEFRALYLEHAPPTTGRRTIRASPPSRTAHGTGSPTTTADPRPDPSTTRRSPGWPCNPSPEPHPQLGTA
jgi:DNA-binding transcriptional MerR regulator